MNRNAARLSMTLIVVAVFELFGSDLDSWLSRLWQALAEVDVEDVVVALSLQTAATLLAGMAWIAILRAAYPQAAVRALPVLACYAVAVAGNGILPASLGTLVMLAMLRAIVHGATFPGLVGGEVVHKLFFVAAYAAVYLGLVATFSESSGMKLDVSSAHGLSSVLLVGAAVAVGAVLARILWSKRRGLWARAKQGGAILADKKAYALGVLLPELGSWLCKLAVIAVFLGAYGIPVTLHTVMSVAGGNSLAAAVSFTPGGVGVTQAVNSAALAADGVDPQVALAYSTGHQMIATAWNVGLAIVLVAIAFGWSGGRQLVTESYAEARAHARASRPRGPLRPAPAEELGD